MIRLPTLYDENIDRSKLSEQKKPVEYVVLVSNKEKFLLYTDFLSMRRQVAVGTGILAVKLFNNTKTRIIFRLEYLKNLSENPHFARPSVRPGLLRIDSHLCFVTDQ